jgi:hypothetical protein
LTIVLAGDWHSNVHERPMSEALERLGHSVHPFAWHSYPTQARSHVSFLLRKAQNKYLIGPVMRRINHDLVQLVTRVRPDLLFVYRGTHVTADALRQVRTAHPQAVLVGYNNDDPFAAGQPRWPWRHFVAAIPEYDRVLAYRPHNIADFVDAGARSTSLMLPWFVPAVHHRYALSDHERARYGCDAVFIGHYEDDGRLDCLETLAESGVQLRIFGPGSGFPGHDWDGPLRSRPALRHLAPTSMLWGVDYGKALSAAKIGLCFLSRRNRDVYTRRCFEIPATSTLMLSEYSDELGALFQEGIEADYFRSPGELALKARHYLDDQDSRQRVAERGRCRVIADGHDVDSRIRAMLSDLPFPSRVRRPA